MTNEQSKVRYYRDKHDAFLHYSDRPFPRCRWWGEREVRFLVIDHVKGGGAEQERTLRGYNICSWLRFNGFPKGYQVLCANCNMAKGTGAYCDVHRRKK